MDTPRVTSTPVRRNAPKRKKKKIIPLEAESDSSQIYHVYGTLSSRSVPRPSHLPRMVGKTPDLETSYTQPLNQSWRYSDPAAMKIAAGSDFHSCWPQWRLLPPAMKIASDSDEDCCQQQWRSLISGINKTFVQGDSCPWGSCPWRLLSSSPQSQPKLGLCSISFNWSSRPSKLATQPLDLALSPNISIHLGELVP